MIPAQFLFDAELHAEAERFSRSVTEASVTASAGLRDFAEAYLDLLKRRGLPPVLRCYPSIQLASGKYFDFSDIKNSPMDPEDMAHALSKITRCNGHTIGTPLYVIAQHCVLGSRAAPKGYKFEFLMHDAHEFVVGDCTTPFKQLMPDFKRYEVPIEQELRRRFLLPLDMTDTAKAIDMRMAATEKRDVMPADEPGDRWEMLDGIEPYDIIIDPWPPEVAKKRWLAEFNVLWPEHQRNVAADLTTFEGAST